MREAPVAAPSEGPGRSASPPVLELREVDVAYHGDIRILQGLSLAVQPGRITGVIGPNGAGKSTALRTLLSLIHI